jgi:hypothetical protein
MHKRFRSKPMNPPWRSRTECLVPYLSKYLTKSRLAKQSGSQSTGQHEEEVPAPAVSYIIEILTCISLHFAVESHLQSQRAAVKMLHDRILVLVQYVTDVLASEYESCLPGRLISCFKIDNAPKDHTTLRSLSALIASLPASENKEFRKEFDTVCISSYLKLSFRC